jgi:hypothetical protein
MEDEDEDEETGDEECWALGSGYLESQTKVGAVQACMCILCNKWDGWF